MFSAGLFSPQGLSCRWLEVCMYSIAIGNHGLQSRVYKRDSLLGKLSALLVCLLLFRHLQSRLHSVVSGLSALFLAHSHMAQLDSVSCREGQQAGGWQSAGLQSFLP